MTPAAPFPSDGAIVPPLPACWTPERRDIRIWLASNAPSLGELYVGAVTMLYDTPVPGYVRFVSHAVREIRNRLPDVVAGPTVNQRLDHTSRLDEITALPGFPLLIADLGGATAPPTIPVTIDRTLATKVADLLQDHLRTRNKPVDAARRLFRGIAPENTPTDATLTPILRQWLAVTNWFMGKAHVNEDTDGDFPLDGLQRQFGLFESAIAAAIRPFFTTLEDLDAILQNANS
jgi:hypothetical protein